jgi:hypothetical protein
MDPLISLIISLSVGVIVGIGNAIREYKAKKKAKKQRKIDQKRIDELERKTSTEPAEQRTPIETPSEDGYKKVDNPRAFFA